jgi:hypothetical protein
MKFKKGDIVLATKKSVPGYTFDDFLQLSPLGVGVVVETEPPLSTHPLSTVHVCSIREKTTLFYFDEEDLILMEDVNR